MVHAQVPKRVINRRSVKEGLLLHRWANDVRGDLATDGLLQLVRLWEIMIAKELNPTSVDIPIWRWNCMGTYTSASMYAMLCEGGIRFEPSKAIWKCWAPLSCKLFMWLAVQYRLWTADRRLRHGLQEEPSPCFICDQEEDTVDHILLQCVFARQIWHNCFMQARIGLDLVPSTEDTLQHWWMSARKRMPKINRKGFDSFTMLLCWHLWKNRNNKVFRPGSQPVTVGSFTSNYFEELRRWMRAGCLGVNIFCE